MERKTAPASHCASRSDTAPVATISTLRHNPVTNTIARRPPAAPAEPLPIAQSAEPERHTNPPKIGLVSEFAHSRLRRRGLSCRTMGEQFFHGPLILVIVSTTCTSPSRARSRPLKICALPKGMKWRSKKTYRPSTNQTTAITPVTSQKASTCPKLKDRREQHVSSHSSLLVSRHGWSAISFWDPACKSLSKNVTVVPACSDATVDSTG